MVGFHFAHELGKSHEVVRVAKSSRHADINADVSTDDGLGKALSCKPDAVMNAIKPGLSVDEMETKREAAYSLNSLLPARLAALQAASKFLLVHISTDGVYAGRKGKIYTEKSPLSPPNYYCKTKAMGEEEIIKRATDYLILRTEGVFGHDEKGTNFFMRMAACEKSGTVFRASSDQWSQPICAIELARLAGALMEKNARGIYNACGADYVSRYSLAGKIKREMGWCLRLEKSSAKSRAVPVQQHLRVDVSKIQKEAGKIAPLSLQIKALKGWMHANQHV